MKIVTLIAFLAVAVAAQPSIKPQPQFVPDLLGPDYSPFFVVGEVKGRIVPARAIVLRRPEFVEEARDAAVEGLVRVDIVIAPDGTVSSAKAVSGPSPLYETCEYAATNSRFLPPGAEVPGFLQYEFRVKKPNWFTVSFDLYAVSRMRPAVMRKAFAEDWVRENEIAALLIEAQSAFRRVPALMVVFEKRDQKMSAELRVDDVPKFARDAGGLTLELRQLLRERLESDPGAMELFRLGEAFVTLSVADYPGNRGTIADLLEPFVDRPPKLLPPETFGRLREFYFRVRGKKYDSYFQDLDDLLRELRIFDIR